MADGEFDNLTVNNKLLLPCAVDPLNNAQMWADIQVVNGGSGYTSAPTVTIEGGGGSGATATATITGPVTGIAVTNGGSGYTSAPSVNFSGGGGSGAAATATISGGHVTAITLTNRGCNYTSPPTITITGGGGSGATATATMSVTGITVTNGGSGYSSNPEVTISDPTGPDGGATATALAEIDKENEIVTSIILTGVLPIGQSFAEFADTESENYSNLFLVISSDNDDAPLLATNQGLIVKKDLMAGGLLGSAQGALWLNHGLVGKPVLSSPPCIGLMDSAIPYPYGTSLPNDPETGQLFNHNGVLKMWDGSSWITGNFSGFYDTLFLFKAGGSDRAHLDLGDLTAHGYVYVNDLSPVPEQDWIDVHAKLRINGDLQLVNGRVVSSLNPSGSVALGSPAEPWSGVVALNGYFDELYFSKLNPDVKLYRSAPNILKTDDYFTLSERLHSSSYLLRFETQNFTTNTYIQMFRTGDYSGANCWFQIHKGDTTNNPTLEFLANTGQLRLPVTGSSAGLVIGGDVKLYRGAANVLQTEDFLKLNNTGAKITFYDIDLYRQTSPSTCLELSSGMIIDGSLQVGSGLSVTGDIGATGDLYVGNRKLYQYGTQLQTDSTFKIDTGNLYIGGRRLYEDGAYLRSASSFVSDGSLIIGNIPAGALYGPLYRNASNVVTQDTSALKYKENIAIIEDASWIYNINPVSFDWKDKQRREMEGRRIGLIAEEVNEVCPELVWTDKEGKPEGVHYEWLGIPLLVEMKKLCTRVEQLEDQLARREVKAA